jgi:hypothetical protein
MNPGYVASRRAMGQTRKLADRIDLARMAPRNDLASTRYCLADPGEAYLVCLPRGGEVTADLSTVDVSLAVEWIHPVEGTETRGEPLTGGARRSLRSPFAGEAVLYLKAK